MNTEIETVLLAELGNIIQGAPLFPGSTLSHQTANECVRLGWAKRDEQSNFIPTYAGFKVFEKHKG